MPWTPPRPASPGSSLDDEIDRVLALYAPTPPPITARGGGAFPGSVPAASYVSPETTSDMLDDEIERIAAQYAPKPISPPALAQGAGVFAPIGAIASGEIASDGTPGVMSGPWNDGTNRLAAASSVPIGSREANAAPESLAGLLTIKRFGSVEDEWAQTDLAVSALAGRAPRTALPSGDASPGTLDRTFAGTAKDLGIVGLKAAISVPEAVIGLADIPTLGMVGKVLDSIGFDPGEAKDTLSSYYSDAQKAAQRNVQQADGVLGKARAVLETPSVVAEQAVESLPLMFAGGVLGNAAVAGATKAASVIGRQLPKAAQWLTGALGEGLVTAGSNTEQVRQQTPSGTLTPGQVATQVAAGIGTGGLSAASGWLSKVLKIADADTLAATMAAGMRSEASRETLAKAIAKGMITEGLLEEAPQSVQEQFWQNVALGQPASKDLDQAFVMGFATGGLVGAGSQFLGRGAARDDVQAAPPPVQPGPSFRRTDEGGAPPAAPVVPPTTRGQVPVAPAPLTPSDDEVFTQRLLQRAKDRGLVPADEGTGESRGTLPVVASELVPPARTDDEVSSETVPADGSNVAPARIESPDATVTVNRGAHDPVRVVFASRNDKQAFMAGTMKPDGGGPKNPTILADVTTRLVNEHGFTPSEARAVLFAWRRAVKDATKEQPPRASDGSRLLVEPITLAEFITNNKTSPPVDDAARQSDREAEATPDKSATVATPEQEHRELRRMLAEMDAIPYEPASYTPLEDGITAEAISSLDTELSKTRGQRIIGTGQGVMVRTSGHAGAPVYHDILQNAPGTSSYTRGQVQQAIQNYLATGKITNAARGALRVAHARMALPGTEDVRLRATPMPWNLVDPTSDSEPALTLAQESARSLNDADLAEYYQVAEQLRRAGWTNPEEGQAMHGALSEELSRRGLPIPEEASDALEQPAHQSLAWDYPNAEAPAAEAEGPSPRPAAEEVAEASPSPLVPDPPPSAPPGPPNVQLDDVPHGLATRAHSGTSWVPEQRAASDQRQYVAHMQQVWGAVQARAKTDDQRQTALAEFERYRQGYLARFKGLLERRSGLISAQVTGPSNFPVRRHEKANNAYQKARDAFFEWDTKAQRALRESVDPTAARSISADRSDAVEALEAKIGKAEAFQATMKAANAIVRRKSLTDAQKVETLQSELNLSEKHAHGLLKPDYMGRVGFPDYELTNNQANIRRMKARIASISAMRATGERGATFDGGSVSENAASNRIEVRFDAKPGRDTIAALKQNGFHWTPTGNLWQRQRTPEAVHAVERLFTIKLENAAVAPASESEDTAIRTESPALSGEEPTGEPPAAPAKFAPPTATETKARKSVPSNKAELLRQIQEYRPAAGEELQLAWARVIERITERPQLPTAINVPPGRVSHITRSALGIAVDIGRAEKVWDEAGNVYYVRPGSPRRRGFLSPSEADARFGEKPPAETEMHDVGKDTTPEPSTSLERASALVVGDPYRIGGVASILAKTETIDGVRFELFNAAAGKDPRATFRMVDMDSGKVVEITQAPTFDVAESRFNKAVRTAKASTPQPWNRGAVEMVESAASPDAYIDELFAEASSQRDGFLSDLDAIAQTVGAEHPLEEIGPFVVKQDRERAIAKVRKNPERPLLDALRSTLVISDLGRVELVLAELRRRGYLVKEITNRHEEPGDGYKDVALKVVRGEGDPVVKELILIGPAMFRAKMDLGHDIYNITRKIEEIERTGGDASGIVQVKDQLVRISNRLYRDALASDRASVSNPAKPDTTSAANSSGVIGEPAFMRAAVNSLRDLLNTSLAPRSAASSISGGIAESLEKLLAKVHPPDRASIAPASDRVDVNEFGEAQPRLPGAESVRDVERETPKFEAPFALTPEIGKPKQTTSRDLFGGASNTPQAREKHLAAPTTLSRSSSATPAHLTLSQVGGAPEHQMRPSELIRFLSDKLGQVPVRVKGYREQASGIYKVKAQAIRLKVANDLRTFAHEIGHHVDLAIMGVTSPAVLDEKYALGLPASRKGYTQADVLKEGGAEFLYYWLSDPAHLRAKAPKYFEAFESQLASQPDLSQTLQEARRQWLGHLALSPEERVASHVSMDADDPVYARDETKIEWLERRWVDDLQALEVATSTLGSARESQDRAAMAEPGNDVEKVRVLGTLDDAYKMARLARGAAAKAAVFLEHGVKDDTGQFMAGSLSDALKPVRKDLKNFAVYLVASRVPELEERGIHTGIDLADAQATIKAYGSEAFRTARDKVYAFQNAILDYAQAHDALSAEQVTKIRSLNERYVPFARVRDAIEGAMHGTGTSKKLADRVVPVKRIRGSGFDIINPLESIIVNTHAIVDMVEKNRAMVALDDLALSTTGGGKFWENIPVPMQSVSFNLNQVATDVKAILDDARVEIPDDLKLSQIVKVFVPANMIMGDKGLVSFVKNGERQWRAVNNRPLYEALTAVGTVNAKFFKGLLVTPTSILRAGATLALDFAARNPIRDSWSAYVNSQYGFKPGWDTVKGLLEFLNKGEDYQAFMRSGGGQSMLVSADRDIIQRNLKQIAKASPESAKEWMSTVVSTPIDLLRAISEASELATRLGEFKQAVAVEGRTPEGFATAAFAARNVTIDFARAGTLAREWNGMQAFFNANVQGIDRMRQVFTTDPVGATRRAVLAITLPSLLCFALNYDDDEYEELPDWEKNTYWHIPLGREKGHSWVRIPKPFDLGAIFGNSAEAALRYVQTSDVAALKRLLPDKNLAWTLLNATLPTAFRPFVEVMFNTDTFRQRPIVNPYDRQAGVDHELLQNRWTSETAKVIGKGLHLAPAIVDHLIYGYTAGLGRTFVKGLDMVGNLMSPKAQATPSSPGVKGVPVLGVFLRPGGADGNGESLQQFYLLRSDVQGTVTNLKRFAALGEKEKVSAIKAEHPDLAKIEARIKRGDEQLTDLRKRVEKVFRSPVLTSDQKRLQLDSFYERMTDTARVALGKRPIYRTVPGGTR